MSDLPCLPPNPPELMVVIAHPDDEIIFFFHAIHSLAPRKLHLVCAVSSFDGEKAVRNDELERSARYLGASLTRLGFCDETTADNPDHKQLTTALAALGKAPGVPVLTHGPMGEYGHNAHMAVFRATCAAFGADVWALSGPLTPHQIFRPTSGEIAHKAVMLGELHPSQHRVASWICRDEHFTKVSHDRFAPLFLPDLRSGAGSALTTGFLAQLARSYLGSLDDYPSVARSIAGVWSEERMRARLTERYEEWRTVLMGDSAEMPG